MMVIGSCLVLPAICLLFPALALVFTRDGKKEHGWGEVQLGHWLMRSVDAVQARPKTVAFVTAVVALVASLGAVRLEVETDFTRNFRRGSRIVKAYDFVETHLGGAGVWDVIGSRAAGARARNTWPASASWRSSCGRFSRTGGRHGPAAL